MKKLITITLSLLMVLSLAACSQAQEPKTETRYLPLEVVHEMAPDYVLKYVYHYNENWVQTGVTSHINGELDRELTYELDPEHNQILKMTAVSGGITSVTEYKNTYDEKGNLIKQESIVDGVAGSVIEYTYDADGNRLSQTTTTEHPTTGLWINEVTFDAKGNMLTMSSTMGGTESYPGSGTFVTYTYDEYGNQIESVQTGYTNDPGAVAGAGRTVSEVADGKITKTTSYDPVGNVTEYREFTWKGSVQTEKVYNPDGTLVLTGIRTYDDAGNLLSSETISEYSSQRSTYTYEKVELPVE